ncbi:hypothetical protein RND61_14945 [Streptomyces sp. TRM76323]|uniref:Uncharacterized protein n=1 Tax=Streptomyces tamarix TaxID=3078565 RepID=A0ABU3QKR4_9ACTN|nr:hypothetical protein [Streptomyces tamarix]MDT9683360.1 hypothetical protein [Streptomyces tamarix]
MKPSYKVKTKVEVIPTAYLHNEYESHVGGNGTIVELVKEENWKSKYVPEYIVMLKRKRYLFPQYSLERI